MGKTEQYILDEIARNPHKVFSFSYGYRAGASMRCRSWGSRVHAAACKLRDKGLVKFVASQQCREPGRWHTDHWTEVVVGQA
jgi:hypothetical protein